MSLLSSRPALRWVVPAGVVGLAVAVTSSTMLVANASPSLPQRTAAQLLVDVQNAEVDGFSGTVVQKADLGLPALPSIGGQGSSELSSLVSGAHTLRVWYAGVDKARVALLGTLGESDVVRNGRDVWVWSSQERSANHYRLPEGELDGRRPAEMPNTPQEAAEKALAAIDPSTRVSTDGTATVAGRSAYELVLSPRDEASKVREVRLAIDSATKIPLRVRVLARGAQTPAVEIGFTQFSLATPGAEHFRFTPPPGTKVTEREAPDPGDEKTDEKPTGRFVDDGPTIVGSGWTTVAVLDGLDLPAGGEFASILGSLPKVTGAWGSGRLLESRLVSALLTDDGRLLVGAVEPETLYAAALKAPKAASKAPEATSKTPKTGKVRK